MDGGQGSDIDMTTYAKFDGYSDQIKVHVIDSGNMPLAKILYEKFWASSTMVDSMATYLEGAGYTVRDSNGAVLKPGRPVAVAGPSRIIKGATNLSGIASMYADTYSWSIVSAPAGTTLSPASSVTPTFTPIGDGTYIVQLVVSKNGVQSAPSQMTIVVNSSITDPATITFTNSIKSILQASGVGATNCALDCHTTKSTSINVAARAPVAYNNLDRNSDGIVDGTDDIWLYTDIKGRINVDDVEDSPLLLKPSGHHHGGAMVTGFGDVANKKSAEQLTPGDPLRANYDLFLNWILNGAPY
jgi:hypothetical protein